ncbi:hypothetical protein CLAFUW4_14827 [Fulvia fulva]|nr:hypothetical protein CLAFUR0_14820 [Fulvia fulva]WPV22998.1 hypothetical protein CLAFUW4_14827 [Fulvia fulva]WPV37956.1 hypothetical protein CLAFUW7_14828 [Fulvia fulva]
MSSDGDSDADNADAVPARPSLERLFDSMESQLAAMSLTMRSSPPRQSEPTWARPPPPRQSEPTWAGPSPPATRLPFSTPPPPPRRTPPPQEHAGSDRSNANSNDNDPEPPPRLPPHKPPPPRLPLHEPPPRLPPPPHGNTTSNQLSAAQRATFAQRYSDGSRKNHDEPTSPTHSPRAPPDTNTTSTHPHQPTQLASFAQRYDDQPPYRATTSTQRNVTRNAQGTAASPRASGLSEDLYNELRERIGVPLPRKDSMPGSWSTAEHNEPERQIKK